MKTIIRYQRNLFVILLLIILVIGYASYQAISNIVAEQSRLQQQSVAPVFSLVVEEVFKPVHMAQALVSAGKMTELLNQPDLDQAAIAEYLQTLHSNFGMLVFAASEKQLMQYNSDGSTVDLNKPSIEWYPRVKAMDGDIFAVLGNRENVHLYVDIKVYSAEGEFLGIVGVGKSLEQFWQVFQQYKAANGYDLLFVNQNNEVLLSSHEDFLAQSRDVVNLRDLHWYQRAEQSLVEMENLSSILIQVDGEDHVLTQFNLPLLKWRLLLLSPMATRQAEITRAFLVNGAKLTAVAIALLFILYSAFRYQRRKLETRINLDPLTKLPNRARIDQWFGRLSAEHLELAVIMVDIDHFKRINDTHGHNTGDDVIKGVASLINGNVRGQDLAGRWGGEEFILLLPGTNITTAQDIAERIRKMIEAAPFKSNGQALNVTASFGLTYARHSHGLEALVAIADSALYQAKKEGRNRVCVALAEKDVERQS